MAGVVLASLSSGGGELSFLGLTHYYGHSSLAAWASGTGGAGLVGAGAYVTATTIFQWSVRRSLLAFSLLPVIMLISFFLILPRAPLRRAASSIISTEERVPRGASDDADSIDTEEQSLLSSSQVSTSHHESLKPGAERTRGKLRYAWRQFKANLNRSRHLFFPYMLPLLLVYVSEYTINQGVAPTLLFPLSSTPFSHFRAFYPTYNAIYQTGVFISRSSTPFIRFHQLYPPSVLQCLNLIILTFQALYGFLPNVYCVFALVFWEGLLGGLVYVNTFAEITDRVKEEDREFSLGATSVSDSAGVCIAGFLGMAMEAWLCNWQVKRGIDFCRQV
ncbi:MAG: battenin CLN3 protein [Piccolia ochrophora]|nr:MAG: battenin CLN3 protein [Piccolia ochrophora]